MTVQHGNGMQQNSQLQPQQSQPTHFVLPGATTAGFMMDSRDAVGLMAFTGGARFFDGPCMTVGVVLKTTIPKLSVKNRF